MVEEGDNLSALIGSSLVSVKGKLDDRPTTKMMMLMTLLTLKSNVVVGIVIPEVVCFISTIPTTMPVYCRFLSSSSVLVVS